jgi:ceramide glucosyltransferase
VALTFGLPWCLLAAIVAPSAAIAGGYLSAYAILRLSLAWVVGVWGIGDPVTRRSIWLVPVRDAINAMVWIAALFSNTISWRGSKFRVKDGMLAPVPDAPIPGDSRPVINEPTPSR